MAGFPGGEPGDNTAESDSRRSNTLAIRSEKDYLSSYFTVLGNRIDMHYEVTVGQPFKLRTSRQSTVGRDTRQEAH